MDCDGLTVSAKEMSVETKVRAHPCRWGKTLLGAKGALPHGKDIFHAEVVPEGYTQELNALAENRVTIGYRLTDLLSGVVQRDAGEFGYGMLLMKFKLIMYVATHAG
jgi:hypothetical protein